SPLRKDFGISDALHSVDSFIIVKTASTFRGYTSPPTHWIQNNAQVSKKKIMSTNDNAEKSHQCHPALVPLSSQIPLPAKASRKKKSETRLEEEEVETSANPSPEENRPQLPLALSPVPEPVHRMPPEILTRIFGFSCRRAVLDNLGLPNIILITH
ncbi:hypothetical protein V5O48_019422, partial [Marasmius crinis-equi]